MGLKSLTLQIIPWCFHFAADSPPPPPPPSRVLFPDGRVRVYSSPVAAGEVSASASASARATSCSGDGDGGGGGGHLLCRSDAFVVGRRVPELAPGERLAPGKSYVLLPAHMFRSNLSFLSLAASFPSAPKRSAGAPSARPFDVEKTESGEIRVRVSDEFLDGAVRASCADEGKPEESSGINGGGGRVCTTEELEKDYRQLVRSRSASAAWRPKLETIRESKERRRRGSRSSRSISSISSISSSISSIGDDDGGSSGPFGGIKRRKKKKKKSSH